MPRPTLQERNQRRNIQRGVRHAKLRAVDDLMAVLGGFLDSHRELAELDGDAVCPCDLCIAARAAMDKALERQT